MILNKREILQMFRYFGRSLRSDPDLLMKNGEGIPDTFAGKSRINAFGKCLTIGMTFVEHHADGEELSKEDEGTYKEMIRLFQTASEWKGKVRP